MAVQHTEMSTYELTDTLIAINWLTNTYAFSSKTENKGQANIRCSEVKPKALSESRQDYVSLQFFLWQDCRLLNGSIYNHLFSLMRNFTADSSLRARKSNWYILLEFSLTCAGEPGSRTRSPACLCCCDEIGQLYPSELGQQPALLDILSPFQEALPDWQSLFKTF